MSLEPLFREIQREQDVLRERSDARSRVRARLGFFEPPQARNLSRRAAFAMVTAGVCAAALAGLLLIAPWQAKPLTATLGVSSRLATVGTWIDVPETAALPLQFSDGTRIEMAAQSRARLVKLDPHGAHLVIQRGRARVEIVHQPSTEWTVSTGPFTVRVTGTRFDVRWFPEQDLFELALEQGQVEISGCVFGQGRQLAAGQTVRASCTKARLDVVYPGSEPSSAPPSAKEQAAEPQKPAPPSSSAAGPSSTPPRGPPVEKVWLKLARRGAYKEAFAAADAEGFDLQCAQAGPEDLLLLADSARHASELAKAGRAFKSVRSRFPGTGSAALAAFALGRLEFDGYGSPQRAIVWFQTYLREQPRGELTREARGRMLEAMHRSGDPNGAREQAAQYLRDFPAGPHAELARRVLGTP